MARFSAEDHQRQMLDRTDSRLGRLWFGLTGLVASLPVASSAHAQTPRPRAQGGAVDVTDPIVVTGSRTERPLAETPVATQVIGAREISESGARNVAEVLEEQAGVYIEPSFAGAGPELQGLDPNYTLILVDGQRAIGRVGGVIDLRRFPIEDVERIEIVRGASSALYGSDALAGVINIITKRSERPLELDAQGSVGYHNQADLRGRVGLSAGDAWGALSGGLHRDDGFDLDPTTPATSGSELEQYETALRGGYDFGQKLDLGASAEYRYRAQDGLDESGGGALLDRRNRTEDANFFLRPEWTPSPGTRLSLRAGYSYFRDQFMLDQRQGIAFDDYQDTREQMLQGGAQLDFSPHSRHLATVGVEGFHEQLRSERLQGGEGDRQRGALYVQDEWSVLEQPLFVLLPGARVDLDSDFGVYPTPRIATRFDPSSALTLRASFGLGFRAPDFREQLLFFENPGAGYLVEGNPELKPEHSRNVTLGIELHPSSVVWASLSLFRNDLQDMIATELVSAGGAAGVMRFEYANVSSAYTQGVEASVRLNPLQGIRLDLSYAFVDSKDEELDRPLPGRPKHRATLAMRYREPGIGFETVWRAALVGERTFYEDNDGDGAEERVQGPAYANVDLRVQQRIAHGFSGFLYAENVLDAGEPERLTIAPRSFSIGLSYSQ
jgi:outer membrane receptor for ferrienterochelin and colicins